MTITTAKRFPTRIPCIAARMPRLAPLAAALLVALPAQAQWRVTPSVSLTETYSDNPTLASDANKRGQFITELTPELRVDGRNSRLQFTANARTTLFHYSEGRPTNARRNNSQYDASGTLKVIDDFMYVDAQANGGSRAISAFGPDDTGTNRYTSENRTQLANWSISPYLVRRFGNFAAATVRYTHDSVEADDTRFGKSESDGIALNLNSGRAWRDIGWNLRYTRQDVDMERYGKSSSENALAALSYRLHRTLNLTVTGGYDVYDYGDFGGRTSGASWSAGFAWNPTARTAVQASAGRHFLGNTGSLLATHRSRHTAWRASYSDSVTSTRQQFTQGQEIDTASLLDSLFALTYPDPIARRQAVEDYIRLAGLPEVTGEQINFLTNRYFRQKLAQASAAYNMRQHGAVLTLFADQRIALSSGEVDSELLGNQLFGLNDNVRQVGASAAYSYKMNARTSATASLTATRSQSLNTNLERDQQTLRLNLTQRFGRKVSGVVELRHTRGERGFNSADYTENAISATITAQL
ncbi:TIGR03016 family PEP-CTERM system-associated outer membrane protein [Massilia suwonensis]|uniref:TIGR03016 family PEP-CTERM system-associated outer membrane protein n=1 Tax=Massilia suwonensis TaxID=648895 RepID=A0ABW0MKW4_9BURK